jgi:hypothetical protein
MGQPFLLWRCNGVALCFLLEKEKPLERFWTAFKTPNKKKLRQVAASMVAVSILAASIFWLCEQFDQWNRVLPVGLEPRHYGAYDHRSNH